MRGFRTIKVPLSVASVAVRAAQSKEQDPVELLNEVIPNVSGFIFGFISEVLMAGGRYVLYDVTTRAPVIFGELFEVMRYSIRDAVIEAVDASIDDEFYEVDLNYPDGDVRGIGQIYTYFTGEEPPINVVEIMISAALLLNATMWVYQTYHMPRELEVCVQGREGDLRRLRNKIPYPGLVIVETKSGLHLEPWTPATNGAAKTG